MVDIHQTEMQNLLSLLSQAIISGDAVQSRELTETLLDDHLDPEEILSKGLYPGMQVVGERFRAQEIFVPQVLVSVRAMKNSLTCLKPFLTEKKDNSLGTVVIGTVAGDIHDIGKNIVSMMFQGNGFRVVDTGIDTSPQTFLEEIRTQKAQVLGMSALLTTTMTGMDKVVELVRDEFPSIKIIVGGAPVTAGFARDIGADGYAPNATDAVACVREWLNPEDKDTGHD